MMAPFFARLSLLLVICGFLLYSYVDRHNNIMELKIAIPAIAKELEALKEKNMQLQYELDQFESPQNLFSLAQQKEFSHLKFPALSDIVMVAEGVALHISDKVSNESKAVSQPQLATTGLTPPTRLNIDAKANHPGS